MRLKFPSRLLAAVALIVVLFTQQIAASAQSANPSTQSQGAAKTSPPPKDNCTNNGTYVNRAGQTVKRPENCSSAPEGATAQCRDGTYSFSRSRRGTCSQHGGVVKWF